MKVQTNSWGLSSPSSLFVTIPTGTAMSRLKATFWRQRTKGTAMPCLEVFSLGCWHPQMPPGEGRLWCILSHGVRPLKKHRGPEAATALVPLFR